MSVHQEAVVALPQVGGFCEEPSEFSPLAERATELRQMGFVVRELEYGDGDGTVVYVIEWEDQCASFCSHCY